MDRLHLFLGIITAVLAGINLILGLMATRDKTKAAKKISCLLLGISLASIIYLLATVIHMR